MAGAGERSSLRACGKGEGNHNTLLHWKESQSSIPFQRELLRMLEGGRMREGKKGRGRKEERMSKREEGKTGP